MYASRTRNGFTPRSRLKLFAKLRKREIPTCPFANLPEAKGGRWGQGLTAAKMAECRWVKPILVGQFGVCGVDPRPPSPAFALHHAAHRQESAGCAPRAIKARMARTDGLRLPAAGVLYACTACLSMRARVTLMRRRGVRLPDREISSARTFEGNLTAAYLRQCFYATLHDPMRQIGGPIIPDLYDAVLVGVGNDALLLRGIERIQTAEGGLGVVQEWRCEILGG